MRLSRRRYLAAFGGTASIALAGCGGGSANRTTYQADDVSAPTEVSDYLSNADRFDGSMVDLTGRDEVEVMVGLEGNSGNNSFGPPAITVSAGTTVVWTWTGRGSHNIVSKGDGPLDSALTASEGHTYEHTFEETGTYLYYCMPHERYGMKGAVVVE